MAGKKGTPKPLSPEEQKKREEFAAQRERKMEERVMAARERGAHVLTPKCPEIQALVQVTTQLNNLYAQLKTHAGPFSNLDQSKAQELERRMAGVCLAMAELGEDIAKALPDPRARFFVPRNMEAAYKDFVAARKAAAPKPREEKAKPDKAPVALEPKAPAKKEESTEPEQSAATA
ncbi:hypothetical protein [Geoalkalibacter sp.]|uniref:hypothetical protein n=1 Tax=Geoalkalibacter sp. TaxID=3041440 RepID=UPI00272DE73A|nr:hypothetical protein [Geoalkalibacter sp.]